MLSSDRLSPAAAASAGPISDYTDSSRTTEGRLAPGSLVFNWLEVKVFHGGFTRAHIYILRQVLR